MANDTGPGGLADGLNQVSGGGAKPPEEDRPDWAKAMDNALDSQFNNVNQVEGGNPTPVNTSGADTSLSGGQSSYESGSWAIDTSNAVAGNSPSTIEANANASSTDKLRRIRLPRMNRSWARVEWAAPNTWRTCAAATSRRGRTTHLTWATAQKAPLPHNQPGRAYKARSPSNRNRT